MWMLVIVLGLISAACAAVMLRTHRHREAERAQRRRRFRLEETPDRIPLRADDPHAPARQSTFTDRLRDLEALTQPPPNTPPPAGARLVRTIDGDATITDPPFELRASMLSLRTGRFINRLTRRLPPWIVACPRVRLDSLVLATNPAGKDLDDWRAWRTRARFRAIDVVLCDRRSWRPILAIVMERRHKPVILATHTDGVARSADAAQALGGRGGDRILEEILYQARLPLVFASGDFSSDWPLIAPYVDEAILPTRDQCVTGDESPSDVATTPRPGARSNRPEADLALDQAMSPLPEGAGKLLDLDAADDT